ncbi:MAG TPA: GDSL-type esterase/lipase family protein [Candidatus Dormibacteraeota bacterium]|nr:GDSL-type esterase/lipase family protein [Candidatus Dormibacteraeota bacterium]
MATAAEQSHPPYLALGDSVVFGYIAGDGFAYKRPNNFIGYPDYVGQALKLDVVNASCPGEASGGFQLAPPAGNDNGCRPFKAHFPLHVSYAGAATQMAFATQFLLAHPNTKLVTLGLGANDAFILQRVCGADQSCLLAGLAAMSANIDAILGGIRATGYQGVLEVVNYYSLDYADQASVQGALLLNHFETASAAAHGAVIADAFTTMQTAATAAGGITCEAGLLNIGTVVPAPAFPNCDVHPSQAGQQTLAQAVVDAYLAATGNNQD